MGETGYIRAIADRVSAGEGLFRAIKGVVFSGPAGAGFDSPTGAGWMTPPGNMAADRQRYAAELGDPMWSPLVCASVRWHLWNVHEAPMRLVTRDAQGQVTSRVAEHRAISLLEEPNDFYTGQVLVSMMAVSRLLDGNGYAIKIRGGDIDEVQQLWYEPHYTIRPRCWGDGIMSENPITGSDRDKFIAFYEVWRPYGWGGAGGRWYRVDVEDVIHDRVGINPRNPMQGISMFGSLIAEVCTDAQRAYFTATVLQNLGMIPFVVSPRDQNSTIKVKDALKLKEELEIRSRRDRGKPIIAGRAIRVDQLGISPKDMDLQALAKIPQEMVGAALGPNSHVLGFVPEHSQFSNFVEARRDSYESYAVPLHKQVARTFTRDLLREYVADQKVALEYDFRDVIAMAEYWAEQFDMWGKAYRDGVVERYDARKALLLDARDGEGRMPPDDLLPDGFHDYGDHVYSISGNSGLIAPVDLELTGRDPQTTPTQTDRLNADAKEQAVAVQRQQVDGRSGQLEARSATNRGNDRPRAGKNKGTILGGKPASARKDR
jgi:phage portal protein BeeE